MEPPWLETYYNALRFVYWEPHHLGRKKDPDSALNSFAKVSARLRTLEVTLNHNLDQFFRLAPSSLRNLLFSRLFNREFPHTFEMHGALYDTDFALLGAMQPDFLFESSSEVVSIEMKIKSKSNVSQLLKYALLGLAVEMKREAPRQHLLVLLGCGGFDGMWEENFRDLAALRSGINATDLNAFLQKMPPPFRSHSAQFTRIVDDLQVACLNYRQLADYLRAACPPENDVTTGAEVYRKLLKGMLHELSVRGLDV